MKPRLLHRSVALVTLLAPFAASAQDAETRRSANCLVQVAPGFDVRPGAEEIVFGLFQIDAVCREAARDVAGTVPDPAPSIDYGLIHVDRTAPDDPLLIKLSLDPNYIPNIQVPADRFLAAVCRRLGVVLEKLYYATESKLRADLVSAEREVELSRATLRDIHDKRRALFERAGVDDLDYDRILNRARNIEDTLQNLELQSVSKRAAAAAIETRIAEISKRAAAAADDEIASQLLEVVNLRALELAQTEKRRAANAASDADLLQARERLAAAKVDILRHRRENQLESGGELLRKLTEQLAENSAANAEITARAQHLSAELAGIRDKRLLEAAREFEDSVAFNEHAANDRLNAAIERLRGIQERLSNLRKPAVTIIDGDPSSKSEGLIKN